jgi:hypothetical protein
MRSIHNRVRNLETAVRPGDHCGVCGAPGRLRFYVVTETADPLSRCSGSGRGLIPTERRWEVTTSASSCPMLIRLKISSEIES